MMLVFVVVSAGREMPNGCSRPRMAVVYVLGDGRDAHLQLSMAREPQYLAWLYYLPFGEGARFLSPLPLHLSPYSQEY